MMQQRRLVFRPARIAPSVPGGQRPAVVPAVRRQCPFGAAGLGLDSAAVRARMVQRLAAGGVSSGAVLTAMGAVERHRFVDSALVNQAYEDTSLPIGLGQTISKPSVVARMMELLLGAEIARSAAGLGRVLEVGTGCGYQAAVLARLAREVYSIERLRGLHEKARTNLRPLRLANVHLILGDGMEGYARAHPMRHRRCGRMVRSCRWLGASNWPWRVWWRPQPLPMGSRHCW
jgi:protein-L-isoaspartate(D-aspartate) O-methyltransferase